MLRLVGNLLWIFFLGGLITCLEYLVAGLVLCITIIGIPFGIQCFKLAELALFPFGRDIDSRSADGVSLLMNILWFFLAGIWIALTHLMFAVVCAITVIGIPFALQHFKLARLGLWPFGRTLR